MKSDKNYEKYLEEENAYEKRCSVIREKQKIIELWFIENSLSIERFKNEQYEREEDCLEVEKRFNELKSWTYQDKLSYLNHIGKLYFTWYQDSIYFDKTIVIKPETDEEHTTFNEWFIEHWRSSIVSNEISFSVQNSERYITSAVLIENYRKQVQEIDIDQLKSYQAKQLESIEHFVKHSGIRNSLVERVFNCLRYENAYQLFQQHYTDVVSLINIARLWDILEYKVMLTSLKMKHLEVSDKFVRFNIYPFTDQQVKLLHGKLISKYINPKTPYIDFKQVILQKTKRMNTL